MCLVNDGVGSRKELTTKGTVMQDRVQEASLLPSPPVNSSRPKCVLENVFCMQRATQHDANASKFVSGQHPGLWSRVQNVLRIDGAGGHNARVLFEMCYCVERKAEQDPICDNEEIPSFTVLFLALKALSDVLGEVTIILKPGSPAAKRFLSHMITASTNTTTNQWDCLHPPAALSVICTHTPIPFARCLFDTLHISTTC